MDDVVRRGPAELVAAADKQMAADPQHRGDSDHGDRRKDPRHGLDEPPPRLSRGGAFLGGHVQPEVVDLHQACHDPVDQSGDQDGDDRENRGPVGDGLFGDLGERDDHDLS